MPLKAIIIINQRKIYLFSGSACW